MIEPTVEWVLAKKLAELTGLTTKAIDRKRERGIWREGVHYRMIDGRNYYSITAYNAWVAGQTIPASTATDRTYVSRSRSATTRAVASS